MAVPQTMTGHVCSFASICVTVRAAVDMKQILPLLRLLLLSCCWYNVHGAYNGTLVAVAFVAVAGCSMRLLRPQALVQEEAIRYWATTTAYR